MENVSQSPSHNPAHAAEPVLVNHAVGRQVELIAPRSPATLADADADAHAPLWRYVYGGKAKPFFHPLRTPLSRRVLTLFEPHDHVWHRGLWFTIKFINGENFWEENGAPGSWGAQVVGKPPTVSCGDNGEVSITHNADWMRPTVRENRDGDNVVFNETRSVAYRPLGASGDAYALDFHTVLSARAYLLLDRTPYTTWGGYGGLTFRGSRNWRETRLLFSTGETSERPLGLPARWCDLSGKLDGGADLAGGVACFDHPDNPRHPTPWYGGTGPGHYFNAAFLFHEPMTVRAGDSLHLRYRVVVHEDVWDHERLDSLYADWAQTGR